VNLVDDSDESDLSSLLEGIAGFAIIEKATMRKAANLRSAVDVSLSSPIDCTLLIFLGGRALGLNVPQCNEFNF